MTRLYRIEHGGTSLYAAEREGRWRLVDGDIFDKFRDGPEIAQDSLRLLAPVTPSKVVCVGLNYKDHAAEQNKPLPEEPLIFIKPSTAVIGPGAAIEVPEWAGRVDHEAELGLVIKKTASKIKASQAAEYILGLTCVNDVTARVLQNKDGQYTRSKGFDTFTCLGPAIVTPGNGFDWRTANVVTTLEGVERQNYPLDDMIFSPAEQVSMLSQDMTLVPGDVIACGTSIGVGSIKDGARVDVSIAGIGTLSNVLAV